MEPLGKIDRIFEFDGFELIPDEDLLLRHGELVPLNQKALAVLALLIERNGHLVTKSEILDLVWKDAFVEEGSLAKAIWTIRHALGDTTKEKFIQTVPRRGYRFVFPVTVITGRSGAFRVADLNGNDRNGEGISTQITTDGAFQSAEDGQNLESATASVKQLHDNSAPREERSRFRRPMIAGLAGIAVLTIAGAFYGLWTNSTGHSERSLLVLPVSPINADERNELLELGIAATLINHISSADGISVRPLNTVARNANASVDPLKVGREQNSDYVLASTYQIANDEIKVISQLFDVATGRVEETFRTRQSVVDIFAAQDAIASDIGDRVMDHFRVRARKPEKKRGTDNEEAYRLYLQGLYLTDKMGRENQLKAVESLEQAVALDPNYAWAWAAKALAHRGVAFTRDARSDEQYQKSVEAVNRALAFDPNLSEAYSAMCSNKLHYEFDFPGAERACRKAIELDSNSSAAHSNYAMFLNCRGRSSEAIEEIRTAIDLAPASFFNQRIYGNSLYFARRYDEAVTQYKRVIDLAPNGSAYANLVATLEAQGNYDEAFEYLLRSMAVQDTDAETIERVKAAFKASGWRGVLVERVGSVRLWDTNNFRLAGWYAQLGDKDKAFDYLDKAYREHFWAVSTLEVEPQFDPLRADVRYASLVNRIQGNSAGN